MNFQKRYVFGIVVVFLTSLTATELFRGNINEPLLFDQSGLIRILSDLGVVITVTFLLIQLYIHLLWRFDPLCKIPVLKKEYTGTVAYVYKGNISSNKINIKVKQAMDKVRLDMTTPLMRSRTLNGCFVEDRGMPVLYYVFIQNQEWLIQIQVKREQERQDYFLMKMVILKGIIGPTKATEGVYISILQAVCP